MDSPAVLCHVLVMLEGPDLARLGMVSKALCNAALHGAEVHWRWLTAREFSGPLLSSSTIHSRSWRALYQALYSLRCLAWRRFGGGSEMRSWPVERREFCIAELKLGQNHGTITGAHAPQMLLASGGKYFFGVFCAPVTHAAIVDAVDDDRTVCTDRGDGADVGNGGGSGGSGDRASESTSTKADCAAAVNNSGNDDDGAEDRAGQAAGDDSDDTAHMRQPGYKIVWPRLRKMRVAGPGPCPRRGHSMTPVQFNLQHSSIPAVVVFGGDEGYNNAQCGALNDIFVLHNLKFERPAYAAPPPSPLSIPAHQPDRGGSKGTDDEEGKCKRKGNGGAGGSAEWARPQVSGAPPAPRSGHSSTVLSLPSIAVDAVPTRRRTKPVCCEDSRVAIAIVGGCQGGTSLPHCDVHVAIVEICVGKRNAAATDTGEVTAAVQTGPQSPLVAVPSFRLRWTKVAFVLPRSLGSGATSTRFVTQRHNHVCTLQAEPFISSADEQVHDSAEEGTPTQLLCNFPLIVFGGRSQGVCNARMDVELLHIALPVHFLLPRGPVDAFDFCNPLPCESGVVQYSWMSLPLGGHGPSEWRGHHATAYGRKLLVLAGCSECRDDGMAIYVLDTNVLTWRRAKVAGSSPRARRGANVIRRGDSLFVSGGFVIGDLSSIPDADAHELVISSN